MRTHMSFALVAATSLLLSTGFAVAQTAEQGGANTGTATLAGPGQKAGADNANGRSEGRSVSGSGSATSGTSNAGGNPGNANGGNGPGGRY